MNQILLFGLRVIWIVFPLGVGPLLADGLNPFEEAPRSVLSVVLWVLWGLVLFSTFIPRPLSLTVVRFGTVTAGVLVLWACTSSATSSVIVTALIFVAVALLASSNATVGDVFVDQISYGDEKRFLLRSSAAVTGFLRPATYLVSVAGFICGPYLLAEKYFVVGAIICVVGFPLTFFGLRSLHQLNRRWVVLVPAGLVLHDHLALNEPTLFQKSKIDLIGPASIDTGATDFTQGAYGLALEVRCESQHDVWPAAVNQETEMVTIDAFLFTPVRPDSFLSEATGRLLTGHSST